MILKYEDKKDGFVFFTWSLCRFCKLVEPTIMELSKEYNIQYYLVDEHGWPDQFNIDLVPALFEFKDGKVVKRINGVLSNEQVREFITGGEK